jgi:hypothetical protein
VETKRILGVSVTIPHINMPAGSLEHAPYDSGHDVNSTAMALSKDTPALYTIILDNLKMVRL